MRISARNQIRGTVIDVKKGATTSPVRVDIGNGQVVTSSITNESVDDLGIKTALTERRPVTQTRRELTRPALVMPSHFLRTRARE
jgi:molybdopterin-binding protein